MGTRLRLGPVLSLLLLFIACSGGGCPGDPGGPCTPDQTDCRGDFYCAVGGVCTKVCANDTECAPLCEESEDCGGTPWSCTGGRCVCTSAEDECPPTVTCAGGYCQRECADTAQCAYDPYAPRRS